MNFRKTLDGKPIIIDKNGNEILDLTYQSVKDNDFGYVDIILCRDEQSMRPDLISFFSFGTTDKIEDILKANDISLPFSIEAGDVILIPDILSSNQNFKPEGKLTEIREKIKKQYIDTSKIPDRKEFDETYSEFQNREKTALPPNIAKTGDKEMEIKDGKITFGPDVTRKQYKSENIQSVNAYINKLKRNR